MQLVDVVLAVLATQALLRAWFEGDLFARPRARLEIRGQKSPWARLLTCKFCLAYHVAFAVVLWQTICNLLPDTVAAVLRIPLHALAIASLVNWLSSVIPSSNEDEEPPPDPRKTQDIGW